MSEAPFHLRALQAWMQQAITGPHGLLAATDAEAVRQAIAPSAKQTAVDRLAIYHAAYHARLIEVLRTMFPALRYALEDEPFDALALAYLQQHPPRSYTLNRLSDRFVDFLRETRPPRADSARADWADFLIDLARLELAIDEVFDGPGIENQPPLAPETLARASAAAGELRLRFAPCVRLIAFDFPLHRWYSDFRHERRPALPAAERSWMALHRRDYVVRRIPLEQAEYVLLATLLAGQTLAEAIEAALSVLSEDELASKLGGWFHAWGAERMFVAVV